MDKKEKERCVTAMLLLNIAAWLIFLIMEYNLLLTVSFVLAATVLGGIVWFLCLTMNIWLIPQANRGWFISLNGIEYLIFPFTYGIISLILGFVIKLITYIVYRKKKA